VRETLPRARRVAALLDSSSDTGTGYFGLVEREGRRLGIEFVPSAVRGAADLEARIVEAARATDALFVVPSTMMQRFSRQIGALARKHRVPSFAYASDYAQGGVMVTYGVDRMAMFRRTAGHVERILKGGRPADMPIELPDTLELVVNLRTARELGVNIPPAVRVRADRTIE
jgi:putative ABC transport system substrate-binding protein